MLHIALCDDEDVQCALTGELLRQYMRERPSLAARLSVFSSAEALLGQMEDTDSFDLYLLDVIMPGLSGIELGLKLRELGCNSPIIYLTTSPDYAVDSYLAHAFFYLLKPVDPARLFGVLDQAAAQLEQCRSASVSVKTKDGLRRLPLDSLLCAELMGRTVRYTLVGGETVDSVTLRGSFSRQMAPLLADQRFVLCGASFVANLYYVTAVGKGELTLSGGLQLPLSRGVAAQVKKRWGDYWMEGDGQPWSVSRPGAASVQVQTADGLQRLSLDRLLCAEQAGDTVRYTLTGGETVDSVAMQGTFSHQVEPLLADHRFVQCSARLVANLHYVTTVGEGELTLNGSIRVPIPQELAAQVKMRWDNYWMEGGGQP